MAAYETKRLVGELEFYLDQLARIGEVLVNMASVSNPNRTLIAQAADTYRLLTVDVVDIYSLLKRAFRKAIIEMGSSVPKVNLEIRERAFILLREGYDMAVKKMKKLEHQGNVRELKTVRYTTETLYKLTENAARDLVQEAERLGKWTVEWEREIGLRDWLR